MIEDYCAEDFRFDPRIHVLGIYLQQLASKCSDRLSFVCEVQKLGWDPYYRLIYSVFCDSPRYKTICETNRLDELYLLQNLNRTKFADVELNIDHADQCVYTNDFIDSQINGDDFDEWYSDVYPFCTVFGNGLSRNRYNSLNQPPFGDFIPEQCRNLTIGWIVFVLLLGLFITIVNVLVITVLSRDSFYHNTYGVYKFSLAIADLLVGIIVIPFIIILKIRHFFINPMPFRALGEPPKSSDYQDAEIFHFCGIFTVFSIVVSIYTLTSSSIDRYLAVRFPIKYKQRTKAVKILTIIMLSLTWLSAICFSIAPIWAPTLKYGFISGAIMVFVIPDDSQSLELDENMIIENQMTAYAFYICLAGIPLLIVWFVNGLTIWEILDCCSKCNRHHESRRPSAFGHEKSTNQTFEMRIAKTFLAMTSAFTFALFPSVLAVIIGIIMDAHGSTEVVFNNYDPDNIKFLVSFDFVGAICILANSFHNCIIYTVRSPRFKRNLSELASSCGSLCEINYRRFRRSSIWSLLSSHKRISFSSVTMTSRVIPSAETSETKNPTPRSSPNAKIV